MAAGGVWRIDDEEFPTPVTEWSVQVIGPRLNGLPSLNTYYIHSWQWPAGGLETCDMERLWGKFAEQNASGQLDELETDEHDIDASLDRWGTVVYTDFFIQAVQPVRRGLPHYDNPQVTFEIYVG